MRKRAIFNIVSISLSLLLVLSVIAAPPLLAARAPDSSEETTQFSSPPTSADDFTDIPLGPRIVDTNERGISLELVTPDFGIVPGEDEQGACVQLVVDGYSSAGVSGAPELPVKGAMLGIPAQGEVTLTIIEVETVAVPETYTLCPVGHPIVETGPFDQLSYQGQGRVRDAAAYTASGFAPAEPAALLSTGFVRSQRVAEVQFRPFQYNVVTGELQFARRIRVQLTFDTQASLSAQRAQPEGAPATTTVDEGAFEDVLQHTLINYEEARVWRTASQRFPAPLVTQSPTSGTAYKILVDVDGIYQLTYNALLAAGVPVGSLDPRTLQLHNQGNQVAIYVAGEADGAFNANDYVLFYGKKMTTRFTDINVYWLTWGGANGLRMATTNGAPGGAAVPASYRATQRIEQNRVYQSLRTSGPDKDHWYWQYVWATAPTVFITNFTLAHPVTTVGSATVSGLFKGYDAIPHHHTRVYLNGVLIDDATWAPTAEYMFTATLPQSALINGTNTISVSAPLDGGITGDYFLINWFEIIYSQHYTAVGDTLAFNGDTAGTWEYRVEAFTTSAIDVFDISAPAAPVRILGVSVSPTDSTYRLAFQQTIPARRAYLALAPAQRRSPKAIVADTPSDLRSTANGADYIFITHPNFITAIQPLADYHASQGLRVQVVDVTEIYDAFSYGIFDPEAIRSFLTYAYTSWTRPAPAYVLLVGDGHYDFKNHTGRGETVYIPPYLADIDPWMGETAADNRYVAVSGSDILPDMHLGRFPVKTAAETTAMVDKALGYMQNPPATEWNRNILFLADNPDAAGDFYAYSNSVADYYVPPLYNAQKVYYRQDPYNTTSQVRTALFNAINAGRLIVNYVGHGAITYWASERFLQISDLSLMNNAGKLSFLAPMTCLEGYYIYPSGPGQNFSAIAEMLVRAPDKAAVASWSPTGLGLANGHDILNRVLYQAIFFDHIVELGPATTLGKLAMAGQGHNELIDAYILLGDPALALNVLKADLHITQTVQTTPPGALFPEALTYTIIYTNTGPSTAYNVVITDILPEGLENPVVVSSGATITPRPGTAYVWDVANLPAGTGGTITITATVAPTFRGMLDNRVEIASDVLDRNKTNNTATVQTRVGLGPQMTITESGNNAVLTWGAVPGAARYRVHRSTQAYFTPVHATALVTQTALTYTDPNAIGDPAVNYFYGVTALDAHGRETVLANRVGEFDFALLPGSAQNPRYNLIALPIDVTPQLPDAQALASYIGSSVVNILSWNPNTQTYRYWFPIGSSGIGIKFKLEAGAVYWLGLNHTAPPLVTFVGNVPPQGSVQFNMIGAEGNCRFYDISLPLDKSAITRASDLAAAIGNVRLLLRWNPLTNTYMYFFPGSPPIGTNFSTNVGYPYHVCLNPGSAVLWP